MLVCLDPPFSDFKVEKAPEKNTGASLILTSLDKENGEAHGIRTFKCDLKIIKKLDCPLFLIKKCFGKMCDIFIKIEV